MNQRLRKYLGRAVALMCSVVVLAFVTILLNGTLIFTSDSVPQNDTAQRLYDLSVGEAKLHRINRQLVWVTYLSAEQRLKLTEFEINQVQIAEGCAVSQTYCVFVATTQQSGVNLQYTQTLPPQAPVDLPWAGGFVNPLNGAVYDLLGRAYQFQGAVEPLTLMQVTE